jgi:5,10-methylenetetrahydrofolate reductase
VPHILCTGFTREETEDLLIDLDYMGVDNVLAIRGDGNYQPPMPEGCSCNKYALDLVEQIAAVNRAEYLMPLKDARPTNFCIGVTAYPEKHFEAPNMAFDIQQLLRKQEAGAQYAVTQMFFDNQKFFEFKKQAEAAGVTIPILPGLKVLTKKRHLSLIPSIFHTDLPEGLVEAITAAPDDKAVQDIGVEFAVQQSLELLEKGEKALHFYIMQYTKPFLRVREALSKQLV